MDQAPQSRLKELITKGKEQGYLTFAEVNDHLPQDIIDSDQVEDIIRMINDMGIQVFENAPDSDTLMMSEANTDEDAAEAAAQALATVESEIGRTTDPVRMYMREMGTVELLTRKGEIVIAKRIEEGIKEVQRSVSEYPPAINYLLEQWDNFEAEEGRLSDIIVGFLDPDAEEEEIPIAATHIGSELSQEELDDEDGDSDDEDEEEVDTGPDPELAREKFTLLREAYEHANTVIASKGRGHADAQTAIDALAEVFKEFRLVPKLFDKLVKNMRSVMDRLRVQERLIMKHCVVGAGMPKTTFIKIFPGNETSKNWFEAQKEAGESYSSRLADIDTGTIKTLKRLPGYDTLRVILAEKPILVEGPSDELLLKKIYLNKKKRLPEEDGIDIIVVRGIGFKSYLNIIKPLKHKIRVVRDNDGDYKKNIADWANEHFTKCDFISYYSSSNDELNSLEPAIIYKNSSSEDKLNKLAKVMLSTQTYNKYVVKVGIIDKTQFLIEWFKGEDSGKKKVDSAIRIFESDEKIEYPEYLEKAVHYE